MSKAALDLARDGDEQAFADLTEPYRPELRVHCYRILGSLTDAEDVVQETLLAAWRGLSRFEERSSLRSWLYTIATNRCLNALRDAGRRKPPEPVPPFTPPEPSLRGEVTWLQPYPDAMLHQLEQLDQIADNAPGPEARYSITESVELAFVTGLQLMPPRQAATLVLRDVLGFPSADVATMLDTSETAIKGMLQRARASLERHRGRAGSRALAPGSSAEKVLARRFADAFTSGDIDGVVAMLTDDAWLAMPPAPHEYHGSEAIAGFLRASWTWSGARDLTLFPTRANRQPAYICYLASPNGSAMDPAGVLVLTLAGEQVRGITRFLDDEVVRSFRGRSA